MSAPLRTTRKALSGGVAIAIILALSIPGTAAAATRPITFNLYMGSAFIDGRASDNSTVTWRWKDSAGHVKAEGSADAGAAGYWYVSLTGFGLEPGDRLNASDGHGTRVFVVPDLTAVVNRVKNVIKGSAPVGSRMYLDCLYPGTPVPDIACDRKRLQVNDNGRWWYWPNWNIAGGDGAGLLWKNDDGDQVNFDANAPFVVVTIGKAQVSGQAPHYGGPSVVVKDGVTRELLASWSGSSVYTQSFTGTLRDSNGDRVLVEPGQRVVSNIASDAAFTVPEIAATGDVDTDTVNGQCTDTGRSTHEVHILVYRAGFRRGYAMTGTDEAGYFSQDMTDFWFPDPSVVKHGDDLLIKCFQKNGDIAQQWFVVP